MYRAVLLLAVASIACIATAISQQNPPQDRKFVVVPIAAAGSRPVTVAALNISHGVAYPSSVHLSGDVEIKTPVCLPTGRHGQMVCEGAMIVRADEAVLHEDTGEIEAHGNVIVTPLRHQK